MRTKILQLLPLLFCLHTKAQQTITNNGNLQIHAGTSVGFHGNFTNTSSATFLNNGTLYVKGNISTDQSSMSAGSGTLQLNGDAMQTISGLQPFKAYNLVTGNTSGITLNTNLNVSGTHSFSSGIITTSSTPNYLVYESGSSYSGSNDARHVNGWIKKTGTTDFIFPVGNGTYQRPIALNSLSGAGEFNARYFSTTSNTSQVEAPLVSVDPHEYWALNKISGGTASVTMNWDNSKVPFVNWTLPEIRVANYSGSNWTDQGGTATGDVTITGTITSNSISSFNLFTFASRSFPVPLTLISFEGKRIGDYTQLKWTTVHEQDVEGFEVERSDNAVSFYKIANLPARNSGQVENYIINDNKPIKYIAYYRLRSIDLDGSQKLSSVVKVNDGKMNMSIALLTNPVKDKLVLVATVEISGSFDYNIYAANGQLLQQGKLMMQNGGHYQLPLKANIKPGMYSISLTNELQNANIRFMVY